MYARVKNKKKQFISPTCAGDVASMGVETIATKSPITAKQIFG